MKCRRVERAAEYRRGGNDVQRRRVTNLIRDFVGLPSRQLYQGPGWQPPLKYGLSHSASDSGEELQHTTQNSGTLRRAKLF